MVPVHEQLLQTLESLGFSPIEAEVYVLLVQRPASTGYRIAQELGKAAAGVYKAVDALALKGAVVVDDDGAKLWRAVPPDELLSRLAREHKQRVATARESLSALKAPADDERVYRLQDFDQVLERFFQMLERAAGMVVVDLFPRSVGLVRDAIEAAHRRGVTVVAKVYEPVDLDVSYQVLSAEAQRLLTAWPLDWLNVVVDGSEHLLALVDCRERSVHHATYTSSTYLSLLYLSGISSEIRLDGLRGAIADGADVDQLQKLMDQHHEIFTARSVAGARAFLQQIGKRAVTANAGRAS